MWIQGYQKRDTLCSAISRKCYSDGNGSRSSLTSLANGQTNPKDTAILNSILAHLNTHSERFHQSWPSLTNSWSKIRLFDCVRSSTIWKMIKFILKWLFTCSYWTSNKQDITVFGIDCGQAKLHWGKRDVIIELWWQTLIWKARILEVPWAKKTQKNTSRILSQHLSWISYSHSNNLPNLKQRYKVSIFEKLVSQTIRWYYVWRQTRLVMTRTKFEKVTKKEKKRKKNHAKPTNFYKKSTWGAHFLHKFAVNHTWLLVNTHFSQKKRKKETICISLCFRTNGFANLLWIAKNCLHKTD